MANKEAKLNLLITAKDDAQAVIDEFVANLARNFERIKQDGNSLNLAQVFEAVGKAIGDMDVKVGEATRTVETDSKTMQSSLEKLQETAFKSREDLVKDFDQIKSSFDNMAHVNAADLTTGQLARIVKAADEDAPKIEAFATKVGKALESIETTSFKTADEITKDWDKIITKFDNVASASTKMSDFSKADIEKMATAYYDESVKIVGSLKKIQDAEDNVSKHDTMIKKLDEFGNSAQIAGQTMQSTGDSIVGGFTKAIKSAAEFDQNIANTTASLNFKLPAAAKLSGDQIKAMTDLAVTEGNRGFFTANQVAEGMMVLANQGVKYAGITGGMIQTVHDVAAANQQDLGDTANVMTDIANEMGDQLKSQALKTAEGQQIMQSAMSDSEKQAALVASQMPKIGDTMTAAMHSGRMSMTDFLNTMKYVGPQAGSLGISFTDVATSIALLTQHGIKGSQAGTGLRRELTNLLPQSKEAKAAMDALGITTGEMVNKFFNADGSIRSMTEIQQVLHESTNRLGDAQQQAAIKAIFGQYALSAMTVTARESPEAFKQLHDQMDQTGVTTEVLAEKSKGMGIQIASVQNQFDTITKVIGDDFKPVVIEILGHLHNLMDAWNNLSPATRKTLEYIALGVGIFIAVGGAVLTFASTIAFLVTSLSTLATVFGVVETGAEVGGAALAATGGIILAVIAGVILLGVTIYEAIIHWSEITTFFQKLWTETRDITKKLWDELVVNLVKTWGDMKTKSYTAFGQLRDDATRIVTELSTAVQNLWTTFKTWITTNTDLLVNAVVNSFKWLYDHNYYFKDLVNAIIVLWATLKNATEKVWGELSKKLDDTWTSIKTTAEKTWGAITSAIQKAWEDLVKAFHTVIDPIVKLFTDLWNDISKNATDHWGTISRDLTKAWNDLIADAEKIFNGLETYFTGLWTKARQWGANLVNMIADGIRSATSAVTSAVSNIASGISDMLGFHSPTKQGPGSDADTWMPNMMNMLADGIQQHMPTIQNAIGTVAVGLKTQLGDPHNIVNNNMTVPMPTGSSRNQTVAPTIIINIEGRTAKTDDALAEAIANKFRTQMSWAT